MRYYSLPSADENLPTARGKYYSFNRENVHFIVLNTNDRLDGGVLSPEQSKWLKKDIADNADARWIIVLMHEPAYNAEGSMNLLRSQLLEYSEIDLILQGNDMVYARSHVLSDDIPRPDNDVMIKKIGSRSYEAYTDVAGTISLLGGTAGGTLGKAPEEKSELYKKVYDERPVFSAIRVEGDNLAVDAYAVNEDGSTEVIDSFAITENKLKVLRGDVNGDGSITVDDARAVLRVAVKLDNLRALRKLCADVNGNKKITVDDARAILRVSVKLEKFDEEYITYTKNQLLNMDF